MHDSFKLLGRKAEDRVTGVKGVVDSICFDLYGCVQGSLRPAGLDEKGVPHNAYWYDVKRLVTDGEPVMDVPDFTKPEIGSANKSPR